MADGRFSLEGQVALVTGASRGIGEAVAMAMAQAGARVVLAARKADTLEAVRTRITAKGGTATAVPCHTGRLEQLDALMEAAIKAYGQVDVLVNNAATNPHFGPMVGVDAGAYEKTFEVNVRGYFELARRVAAHLQSRNAPGSIINVSSVLGIQSAAMMGVYGMTKAAVLSMTRTLGQELGGAGIRVNALAPGLIQTQFAAALTGNDDIRNQAVGRTPLGRLGDPDDVAGAAVFLASPAARFITGQVLVVDGGLTLNAF